MKKTVLGVKIDDLSMNEALLRVGEWMEKPRKHYIVTPNPEFVMAAQEDSMFRHILNKADLSIPDGRGLRLAGVANVVPGVDFMEKLCEEASKNGWSVGFLGGRDGVAKKCAEVLQKRYPGLKVGLADSGGEVDKDGVASSKYQVLSEDIDFLFIGFGHGKQEKWIVKHKNKINAKVFMGVGGSFDYISGAIPRAPILMRNFGLEWLFRLLIQPWRINRQMQLIAYVLTVVRLKIHCAIHG